MQDSFPNLSFYFVFIVLLVLVCTLFVASFMWVIIRSIWRHAWHRLQEAHGIPVTGGQRCHVCRQAPTGNDKYSCFQAGFFEEKMECIQRGFCGTGKLLRREAFFRRMLCWSGGGGASVLTLRMRLEIACP